MSSDPALCFRKFGQSADWKSDWKSAIQSRFGIGRNLRDKLSQVMGRIGGPESRALGKFAGYEYREVNLESAMKGKARLRASQVLEEK